MNGNLFFMLLSAVVFSMSFSNPVPDAFERIKRATRVRRVIGGRDIMEGEWPWLIHLTGRIPSKTWWGIPVSYVEFYCGGSIISNRWVLTAAHCFDQAGQNSVVTNNIMKPKHWHVKAGEIERKHNIFDTIKSGLGSLFGKDSWKMYYEHVKSIHVHPDYSSRGESFWANDICLLEMREDFPLGVNDRNIGAISLPSKHNDSWPAIGANCTMKGWGCTAAGGSMTNVARAVVLPVRTQSICNTYYGNIPQSDKRMCAGPEFQDKGICPGDSGGPLVCREDGDNWIHAGIASFTSGNQPQNIPAIFTRTSRYLTWIYDIIGAK